MRLPEATGPLPSVKKHTGESRASARTLISGRFISYISRSLPEQRSAAVKNASCPPALSPMSETLPGAPEKLPALSLRNESAAAISQSWSRRRLSARESSSR